LTVGLECSLDGSTMTLSRASVVDPGSGEHFDVWRCGQCGLGVTNPQPLEIESYYAPNYHGDRHGFSGRLANRRRLRFVDRVAEPGTNRQLVDIGCGDGSFLTHASNSGWTVAGTELNPALGLERGLRVATSIEELSDLRSVDAITLWHSLEHMVRPGEVLASLRPILSERGVVLIAVPNIDSLQSRVTKASWLHLDVPRHLTHFTKTSIAALLKQQGFASVRWWNLEFEYDLVGWSQSLMTRFTNGSPVFFDTLTRHHSSASGLTRTSSLVAGSVLSACALPVLPFTTLSGQGAVLIVAARALP
jgi:predicted SAM-dependent methyltransferase